MKMFLKLSVATLFVLLSVQFDVSLANKEKRTGNQKSTYIVHVNKSEMPTIFDHHAIWYNSILTSINNSQEMLYTYEKVIHGFSAKLTHEEVQSLRSRSDVVQVMPEQMYKPLTTRTPHFLGIDKIDEMVPGLNGGSDVIIGFLDTGIWPESKSFDDAGLGPIPSKWKGICERSADFNASKCNRKLIGARFYSKGYEATIGPIKGTKSPRDTEGHGSHTASTAAGSVVEGANVFGYAAGKARGMAFRSRIAVYKVCWERGCAVSDILAAMDAVISDHVDILSISLGGDSDTSNYDTDGIAIGSFAVLEHGTVVVCSAGNEGPAPSSINSNIAPWLITVGAGTLDRDFPAYVALGNGHRYSVQSIYSGKSLPDTPIPFIHARNASRKEGANLNLCLTHSLDPKRVRGKIVYCEYGNTSTIEKELVVKSAGGVGMVLGTVEGDPEEELLEPHFLPTAIVDDKAKNSIQEYLSSEPKPVATIVSEGTKVGVKPSPIVAEFSSRGPNLIRSEVLKPDIIAPGVNILAAWSRIKGPTGLDEDDRYVDFNIISGTSMACPHVSGIVALIKSAHPNWSPAAIRSALMTTAYSTYTNGKKLVDEGTNKSSTPFDVGAGHVNPVAALNPGLVYDLKMSDYLDFLCAIKYSSRRIETVVKRKFHCKAHNHYSATHLNYPSFSVVFNQTSGRKGARVVKHKRTLTNVGPAGTYKVSVTSEIPSVKIRVEPKLLSFHEHEKKSYTVTFATSGPAPSRGFGFAHLEWSNGKNVVRSPISILFHSKHHTEVQEPSLNSLHQLW
ncbi:subtilisin-like protease SBT1.7 [Vigna unguiculata]|uniref:subtilisin-like protease SBT1.7 n=1 Tax=Vigna unguiculata TaxID=3917 RepID=UPI001015E0C6|nr:subtilisin-like protease SBT1.7 [Vigna unguiculata]